MSSPEDDPTTLRTRREPPRFRGVAVRRVEPLSTRMVRVTLAGPDLEGFTVEDPAASVRLMLPSPGTRELVMPTWERNEFLPPDGQRATIRTFTPRRVDPHAQRIRRHLFDDRELARARTTVRGCWKHGRRGGPDA